MAEDGPFFKKKPEIRHLEEFDWPDPGNPGYFRGLRERVSNLRANTDCAIVLNLRYGIIHQGQFLRGFADWLKDFYKNPEFMARMMAKITDYWVQLAENALDTVNNDVDIIYFGDDLASQAAPLFNPEAYRTLLKPHHRRIMEIIKSRGPRVVYHSCGAVSPFIDDLIDIGVDALNPVQVSANNMALEKLKDEFGDRIAFWGGIDTQRLLPLGTPDEVRAETRRTIEVLGKGGGYILNSVHNLQPDVPPENIVAMFDEGRTHRYRAS